MQEWSYNYSGTCITPQDVYLAHHGVKGMKWGVRKLASSFTRYNDKKNKKNNSKTYKTSRYSNNMKNQDRALYGQWGVKNIDKRMSKGMSHKAAEKRELGNQLLIGSLLIVAPLAVSAAASNPKIMATIKKGSDAIKNVMAKRPRFFNTEVLNSSGQILKKYHGNYKVTYDVIKQLANK